VPERRGVEQPQRVAAHLRVVAGQQRDRPVAPERQPHRAEGQRVLDIRALVVPGPRSHEAAVLSPDPFA